MEPPAQDHEGAAEPIVGPDQPVLQAEPPAERERPRLLREERVGAALDEKAVAALGLDGAAQTVAGLEQRQVERRARARAPAPPRGGRPRGPAMPAAHHRRSFTTPRPRRTRSASIAMKAGMIVGGGARDGSRIPQLRRHRARLHVEIVQHLDVVADEADRARPPRPRAPSRASARMHVADVRLEPRIARASRSGSGRRPTSAERPSRAAMVRAAASSWARVGRARGHRHRARCGR